MKLKRMELKPDMQMPHARFDAHKGDTGAILLDECGYVWVERKGEWHGYGPAMVKMAIADDEEMRAAMEEDEGAGHASSSETRRADVEAAAAEALAEIDALEAVVPEKPPQPEYGQHGKKHGKGKRR